MVTQTLPELASSFDGAHPAVLYSDILEGLVDGGLVFLDSSWSIIHVSPRAARMLGWDARLLLGRKPADLARPHDRPAIESNLLSTLAGHAAQQAVRTKLCTQSGDVRSLSLGIVPIDHDRLPDVSLAVSVRCFRSTDAMQAKLHAAEATLAEMVSSDPMTGLANARLFDLRLQAAARRAQIGGYSVGVVLFTVRRLREVNRQLGTAAGDELLKAIADVLMSEARRPTDLAARLGSRDFAVLFPLTPAEHVEDRAAALRAGIQAELSLSPGADLLQCYAAAASTLINDPTTEFERPLLLARAKLMELLPTDLAEPCLD